MWLYHPSTRPRIIITATATTRNATVAKRSNSRYIRYSMPIVIPRHRRTALSSLCLPTVVSAVSVSSSVSACVSSQHQLIRRTRNVQQNIRRSCYCCTNQRYSSTTTTTNAAFGAAFGTGHNSRHHHRHNRSLSSKSSSTSTTTVTQQPPPPPPPNNENQESKYRLLRTLLTQHLWPSSSSSSSSVLPLTTTTNSIDGPQTPDNSQFLKQRVAMSIGLMMCAKAITIQVPFVFKQLVDTIPIAITTTTTTTIPPPPVVVETTMTAALDTAAVSVAGIDPNLIQLLTTNNPEVAVIPIALVLGYGISRATAVTLQELRNTIFHSVVQDATRNIGNQVLYHTLHHLDLQYHLSKSTGQLSRIMEHGLRSIATILNSMVFHIVPTLLEVSLVTGVMYYQFGTSHAAVVLLTVGAYTTFTFVVTSWRTKFRREMNRLGALANGRTVDSYLNYETIQYFNNVSHELSRYNTTMKSYGIASQEAQQSLSLLNIGQSTIFSVGLTAIMYLTYAQILNDQATIGDLVLANGLLFQVSVPLFFIGSVYRELKQSFIDMEKMDELIETEPTIVDSVNAIPYNATTMGTSITLQDVHFAYPAADATMVRPILRGTTLTVPQGTTTAIVGSSGCGKSTILRLLYRFYEANSGSILIGGHNIHDLQKQSIQKSIAVIPQDVVLFNETIGYNINYGNLNASMDQVIAAAKKSKIHDIITSFPAGYDTIVGERGLKLSGGEKQRVSIARAILKDSPILLCDEPTSSLDGETEMDIMNNIKSIGSDRSTIIIAHRLSTVQDCDQIIVMHLGRVVERGTHEELIRMNGRYTELLKMQQDSPA